MTRSCNHCSKPVTLPDELVNAAIEVLCPACQDGRDQVTLGRRRSQIGLRGDLADFTFDSIDYTATSDPDALHHAVDAAQRWAAGDPSALGLGGPVGTGKTRVAVAAANEMVRRRAVRFYSVPVLIARLGTGTFHAPERMRAVEVLLGDVALVLDDLDKTRPTPYAAEVVYVAIDSRVEGSAPLLVTTNLSLRELAVYWPQPWGEAIASRLLLPEWIRLDGQDRRAA